MKPANRFGSKIEENYAILELGWEDEYYHISGSSQKVFALGTLSKAKLFVEANKTTQRFKIFAVKYFREEMWNPVKPINMTLEYVKQVYKDWYFRKLTPSEKEFLWIVAL